MTAPSPRSTTSDLEAGRQIDRIVEEAMRVLIAGASGAIGRALVRRLRANQHEVFALTQSHDSAPALKENGAEPVIADALDAAAVTAAVGRIRPDAVINELTSLPRHYTPAEMKAAAERDPKHRADPYHATRLHHHRSRGRRRSVNFPTRGGRLGHVAVVAGEP